MKRALGLVLALLLAYPLITWLMGFAIEARLQSFTQESILSSARRVQQEHHGGLLSYDDETYELGSMVRLQRHYRRGWYQSVDEGTIEMAAMQPAALGARVPAHTAMPSRIVLSYRTVIRHGPVCGWTCFALAGFDTALNLESASPESAAQLFPPGEAPLKITGRLDFAGGGFATFSSPAIHAAALAGQGRLSWEGLEGHVRSGAHGDWYEIALSAPGLHLSSADGGQLDIEGITLTGGSKRALRSVFAGDTALALERFALNGPSGKPVFAARQVRFANHNLQRGAFLDAGYQLGGAAVDSSAVKLASVHFDSTFKHLELEALANLADAMRGANDGMNPKAPPMVRTAAMMAKVNQPFESLLLKQPEWDLDRLSAANAQGQVLVSGVVRCPDLTAADFGAGAGVLKKIDARIELAVDQAFLTSIATSSDLIARLQPLIDQGYLALSNGTLRSEILFQRGMLTVNGKPFAPGALPSGT